MSHVYYVAKAGWLAGTFAWNGGDTFKLVQCMGATTNTTCDTENAGISVIDDFTTLGEHGTAGRSTLTCITPAVAGTLGKSDANDVLYAALADGADALQGTVCYKDVGGSDATNIPMGWFNYPGLIGPGGSDLNLIWNDGGLFQIT